MCRDRIGFIQLAMILAIILYMWLHKDIGLKSLKEEGLSTLGMRVMKVDLKPSDILPLLLISSMIPVRSIPKTLKKAM